MSSFLTFRERLDLPSGLSRAELDRILAVEEVSRWSPSSVPRRDADEAQVFPVLAHQRRLHLPVREHLLAARTRSRERADEDPREARRGAAARNSEVRVLAVTP